MSSPYYADEQVTLWHGDCLTVQRTRAWADFPHRTRTSVASWMTGETA